ncbi:MAG: putative toxin-antitoxin system toxin component, PIN family [Candidatus Nealsonbacteria bacterium]|nr:putative toxin-antitoxin system toxin component, PIN family [Candidatus Nealsonbacteria bacterium]
MKVVVDTNLFVARKYNKESASSRILELAKQNKIQILWTEGIKAEIEQILKNVKADKLLKNLGQILKERNQVFPRMKIKEIREDPQDNKFLECALEGGADLIVSSDKDILRVGSGFQGIPIFTPKNAVKFLNDKLNN